VYKAQAVAKEAKLEYEGVTQRVISEFEVFKCQKMVDMRDIMLNFVNMQVRPRFILFNPVLSCSC
jgi:hypothetical protein